MPSLLRSVEIRSIRFETTDTAQEIESFVPGVHRSHGVRRTKRKMPVDSYVEAGALLRHIRGMEAVDDDPEIRRFHTELHGAFLDILQEEFAPHALTFALAIAEIEDAMPSVTKLAG